MPCLSNSVDPDQLASNDLHCVIKYVNFYQKHGSGRGVFIYSAWEGLKPAFASPKGGFLLFLIHGTV